MLNLSQVLYRAQDGHSDVGVGCMMWRKVASKTSEEEDDRMKGGERSARAERCDERRARPRGGV